MKDLIDELTDATRTVGSATLPAGEAHVIELTRTYPAELAEVWDALTDPSRIARWFLPVSGDLRVGGTFQLEGHAGGEIRVCEPPSRLLLTWGMGAPSGAEDDSIVEVRLRAVDDDHTEFTLTHTAVAPPEMWDTYGPGAVGVGWDGALLGLAALFAGVEMPPVEEVEHDPSMRGFMTASSESWGAAYAASGVDGETVARVVAATTAFYVPPA